jgi:hypothetical protein
MKAEIMPVITGTISKLLRLYLSNITGKHKIKEQRKKKAIQGHCAHAAESANVKV